MVFKKLFGSESDKNYKKKGIVWASFNRKFEKWHFGPNDEKYVVYDGIEKDVLYKFIDNQSETRRTTSYNRELNCNYESVLFTEDIDEEWKEKRRDDKKMYLVAEGSWDTKNLRYDSPVLVVEESTFQKLKNEVELANDQSMIARPKHLHRNMRKR